MRTETINIYKFDELSDEAKEKAREWWRELEAADPAWANERRESLDAFCATFSITATRWSYDAWSYDIDSRWCGDESLRGLSGPRLLAHLWNNYCDVFACFKQYGKRFSKIMIEPTDCPFTGYCMDETLLDPIRAFMARPTDITFEDLLQECLNGWGRAARDDVQWMQQDEQVDDAIKSNEYEFTVDGSHY